jgi:hypothetical protein
MPLSEDGSLVRLVTPGLGKATSAYARDTRRTRVFGICKQSICVCWIRIRVGHVVAQRLPHTLHSGPVSTATTLLHCSPHQRTCVQCVCLWQSTHGLLHFRDDNTSRIYHRQTDAHTPTSRPHSFASKPFHALLTLSTKFFSTFPHGTCLLSV